MKISMLTLALTLMISGLGQAQALALADTLQQCRAMVDNLARLTCYDKLANQMVEINQVQGIKHSSAKTPPPPADVSTVAGPAPGATIISTQAQEQTFGLTHKPVKTDNKITKVAAVISSVSQDPYGKLIIALDNQQVWKQSDTDRFRLKAGDQVYVEEGAMSSFFLSKESLNKRIRVRRIK